MVWHCSIPSLVLLLGIPLFHGFTFSVELNEDIIPLKVPDHPLDPSPSRGTLRCIIKQI